MYLKYLIEKISPLKDAAAVNATRFAIGKSLKDLGLPVGFWTGGRTKFNRCQQAHPKDHWIDAACVGISGSSIRIDPNIQPLEVKAQEHGSRQKCRVNRFGFPQTSAKREKRSKGFQTGDLVKTHVITVQENFFYQKLPEKRRKAPGFIHGDIRRL